MSLVSRGCSAAVGAATAAAVYRAVDRVDKDRGGSLVRTNHRGEPVTLALGAAVVAGAATGIACAPGIPVRVRAAGVLASGCAGGLGFYDDVVGAGDAKGIKGHVGALARGEVTSGVVKILGIGVTGWAAGFLARGGRGGVIDAGLSGVLVAGSANLLNLFDLRPGRAAKVFLVAAAPSLLHSGLPGTVLAAPTGALLAVGGDDLAERAMLGDTGANALGALLGTAGAIGLSRGRLVVAVTAVVGLTLLSERVSFSSIIDQQPALSWLDSLGRRPLP